MEIGENRERYFGAKGLEGNTGGCLIRNSNEPSAAPINVYSWIIHFFFLFFSQNSFFFLSHFILLILRFLHFYLVSSSFFTVFNLYFIFTSSLSVLFNVILSIFHVHPSFFSFFLIRHLYLFDPTYTSIRKSNARHNFIHRICFFFSSLSWFFFFSYLTFLLREIVSFFLYFFLFFSVYNFMPSLDFLRGKKTR